MVRAAAKNHPSVAVVTSPARYADVLVRRAGRRLRPDHPQAARRRGLPAHRRLRRGRRLLVRRRLRARRRVAVPRLPRRHLGARAHPALRREPAPAGRALLSPAGGGLAQAEQLHGKEMSYNNYTDTDAARRAAYDHAEPCVAIIKHANPCGIAVAADVAEAHRKAHACDPLSAFGGVIAVNRPVSKEMAEQVAEIFTEVIVAPGLRGRRPRGPHQEEEHPRPALRGRPRRRPSRSSRSTAARCSRSRTGSRPTATTRPTGRWRPARR